MDMYTKARRVRKVRIESRETKSITYTKSTLRLRLYLFSLVLDSLTKVAQTSAL